MNDQPSPAPRKQKSDAKVVVGVVGAVLVIIVLAIASQTGSGSSTNTSDSPSASPTPSPVSAAYKLADYDLGHSPDASTVVTYQTELDSLKPSCTEDEDKLTAEIWASWGDLKKHGVTDETNLTLIGHIKIRFRRAPAPPR